MIRPAGSRRTGSPPSRIQLRRPAAPHQANPGNCKGLALLLARIHARGKPERSQARSARGLRVERKFESWTGEVSGSSAGGLLQCRALSDVTPSRGILATRKLGWWPTFTFFVKVGIHAACGSGRFWEFGLVEIKIPSLRRERERLGHSANSPE